MSNKDNTYFDEEEYELEYEDDATNINWANVFRKLYSKRKLFIISFIATILIVYPIARTNPQYYRVVVKLAPEFEGTGSASGNLSSIMKSFGVGGGAQGTNDAILPTLYPDLMNSKAFLVSLFDVPVQTKDGKVKTTYYDYLDKHQKSSITSKVFAGIFKAIGSIFPNEKRLAKPVQTVNAGRLTKKQSFIAGTISKKVLCGVDKKTGVITIRVTDQDPVICATIADSACSRLQEFITEYRTKKARIEMTNAEKQYKQAAIAYEEAKNMVESFNNSNWDLVDEDLLTEKQALQNDMQMRFTNMSAFNQQYLAARTKYESLRPVYTVLDGASVPLRSSGPSRMKSVIMMLFLVLGSELAWVLYLSDFCKKIKAITQEEAQ